MVTEEDEVAVAETLEIINGSTTSMAKVTEMLWAPVILVKVYVVMAPWDVPSTKTLAIW